MNKDKNNVVERLRSKIQPENRIFVRKNLAISGQVETLRKEKGWSQKDLARQLGKTESEVSRMLSGLHNITLKSIAKLEAAFGSELIVTPLQACEKYKSAEYVTVKVYVPVKIQEEKVVRVEYAEESNIEYQKTYKADSMRTIYSEMISILSVKVFKSNIEATSEYIDKPEKPSGVEIKLEQNTAYNLQEKNIRIRLLVNLQATKNKTEKLGLTAEFGIEFHIHVENIKQFITERNGTKIFDRKIGGVISRVVYSTARGIIMERTSTTFFNTVVLPVIDTNLLLENK